MYLENTGQDTANFTRGKFFVYPTPTASATARFRQWREATKGGIGEPAVDVVVQVTFREGKKRKKMTAKNTLKGK